MGGSAFPRETLRFRFGAMFLVVADEAGDRYRLDKLAFADTAATGGQHAETSRWLERIRVSIGASTFVELVDSMPSQGAEKLPLWIIGVFFLH
jgi:hypothetical protein